MKGGMWGGIRVGRSAGDILVGHDSPSRRFELSAHAAPWVGGSAGTGNAEQCNGTVQRNRAGQSNGAEQCTRPAEGAASGLASGVVQRQSDGRLLAHRHFQREVPPRQGPAEIGRYIASRAER